MTDRITLSGMQFYARHGVDPGERKLGQRFEIDVDLWCDCGPAGRDDDLSQSVDYQAVYRLVAASMEPPCLLLEAVAERVAQGLLASFPLESVTVRVRKPSVPLGGVVAAAEVEITRAKRR